MSRAWRDWLLAADMDRFQFTGVVKHPFNCPFYTNTYPNGKKQKIRLETGQSTGQLVRFEESTDGTYLSALTETGFWINVWSIWNKRKRPVLPNGIRFVDIQRTPKLPPTFDTDHFQYTGMVLLKCPFYEQPYPHGDMLDCRLEPGQATGQLVRFEQSADGTYLSALTEVGWWIVVWSRWNRHGRPSPGGIWFVDVHKGQPKDRQQSANPHEDPDGQDRGTASSSSARAS